MEYISHYTPRKIYTPLRRFYAWVGFCSLIFCSIGLIVFLVWANRFIDAHLV